MMFIVDPTYIAKYMKYGDILTVGFTKKCRSDIVKPSKIKTNVWNRYTASTNQIMPFVEGQKLEYVKTITVKKFISKHHDGKNEYDNFPIVIYRYGGKTRLLTPGNIKSLNLHVT